MRVTEKAALLTEGLKKPSKNEAGISPFYISELLAGRSVALSNLFGDDRFKDAKKITLQNDLDANYNELCEVLDDHISVVTAAKDVYDAARFSEIIGTHRYLCDAKIAVYKQNNIDLRVLKDYIKAHCIERYNSIFCDKEDKLDNYAAYSQYHHKSGDYTCSQEAFCKFLKKSLPEMAESKSPVIATIYQKIVDGSFLPRLRSSENGVIPYQLQLRELDAILKNASLYLPFLAQQQCDGYTPAEKIRKTFEFRVPYYVGPLNDKAAHHWAVRSNTDSKEKIYPWNFNQLIDLDHSAEAFLVNLIGRCTYTGDPVLPKDSLLYSEYMLLNELNPLKIDGQPLSTEHKKQLIKDKYKPLSTMAPAINLVFASNFPIRMAEEDTALLSRMVVIPFRFSIPTEQQDHLLTQKILAERDGIFLRAIHAYHRLLADKYIFAGQALVDQLLSQSYASPMSENQNITAFLNDCCILTDDNSFTSTQDLHEACTAYCVGHDLPIITDRTRFSRILRSQLANKVKPKKIRIGDKTHNGYIGIKLSNQ